MVLTETACKICERTHEPAFLGDRVCIACKNDRPAARAVDDDADLTQALVEVAPNVTSQPHYTKYTIEPIAVIEDWGLGFHLGNVVKYLARWRDKGGVGDLEKAEAYLHRHIHGCWPSTWTVRDE